MNKSMNIRRIQTFTPPLKPAPIPQRLIYGNGKRYFMFDTKNGSILGKLKVTPMVLADNKFYKNSKSVRSLYINNLFVASFARRNKVGKELVEFAKNLSSKENCGGRVHCVAYNPEKPSLAPHKFWRKQGFSSASNYENRIIDFTIENDIPIPPDMCQGTAMYFAKNA